MTLEKLPLVGTHVDPFTTVTALKVNEIIDYINKLEVMFGMTDIVSPPKSDHDVYKENQIKGNDI